MIKKWLYHLKKHLSTSNKSSPKKEPIGSKKEIDEWKQRSEEYIQRESEQTIYQIEDMELIVRAEGFIIRTKEKEQQSDVWKKHSTHWRNFWLYDNEGEMDFSLINGVELLWNPEKPRGALKIQYKENKEGPLCPLGNDSQVSFRTWPQFFALRQAQAELLKKMSYQSGP